MEPEPEPQPQPESLPPRVSPWPFVVASVLFVVIAAAAFLFLRPDDSGELVRPDRLEAVDGDTVEAVALDRSPCERVVRAQVDMAEDAVFVELVVEEDTTEACAQVLVSLEATVTLPEPVGGRELRPGIGRFHIPCSGTGTSVTCEPDR